MFETILILALVVIWLVTVWHYEQRITSLEVALVADLDVDQPFNVTDLRPHLAPAPEGSGLERSAAYEGQLLFTPEDIEKWN